MRIRQYYGKSINDAISKVKEDLGNEALILHTCKVSQKGLSRIFSRQIIEVIAAMADSKDQVKQDELDQKRQDEALQENMKIRQEIIEMNEKLRGLQAGFSNSGNPISSVRTTSPTSPVTPVTPVNRVAPVTQEAADNQVTPVTPTSYTDYDAIPFSLVARKASQQEKSTNRIIELIKNNIIDNGVEAHIAEHLLSSLEVGLTGETTVSKAITALYEKMTNILGAPEPINLKEDGTPTVAVFTGPTGAGKTTTIAKIAANYHLKAHKSVGLISADTYRVAAVEQLKSYSEILGLPFIITYSVKEVEEAIKEFKDKDLILIDTASRSHRNDVQFEEIENFISAIDYDEVYLVLSMTTSFRNCMEVIEKYAFLNNFRLIFTKADEIQSPAIILNACFISKKSLSYITTGQNVPEDIEIADKDKIVRSVLGNVG